MLCCAQRSAQCSTQGKSRKTAGPAQLNAYKSSLKRGHKDCVTIEDVKQVALNLLQEDDALTIPLCFLTVMKSRELDEFLAALLLYLYCYFEKKILDQKPKPLMAEQSITEKQVMAEASARVQLAQKQLAYCYSSLVLGLGLSQEHHMACGRNRVSSTYRDRQLYECLYSFFCYVAWVTFGRRDLRGIQQEVGRLLRSDTFNPARRTRQEDPGESRDHDSLSSPNLSGPTAKEGQAKDQGHPSPALEQRKSRRRPALSSMMTQRSPVLVSLLPLPREEAPHLFVRSRLHDQQSDTPCDTEALLKQLNQKLADISFGILGKPLSQFSCTTLMPQGANTEDEEDDEDDDEEGSVHVGSSKTSSVPKRAASAAVDKRASASRANTGVSRATTEGVSSDTE
ncbi:protein phosphatase 1 regulatory subunit 36 [Osmerus eperlanus]|uniref:protein phosphatase 1 regulatory subunit 36 n=1 Tax=Osmerus eperlanus TaxID=29151 RepID=UPI002E0EE7D3